jgi:uncharacterized membrane protein YfcA
MDSSLLLMFAALAAAGLFAGFIGGLFGVGGGIVIVPVLYYLFETLGAAPEVLAHAAVATSLSTIIATSWRSLSAHAKTGAVDFNVLRSWAPAIVVGAALGSIAAGFADTRTLLVVFGVGLAVTALQMAIGTERWQVAKTLPVGPVRDMTAGAIGFFSAMMGIGGGAFGVTVMTLCGRSIHQAVATASGFGAAIAIPAALGYVASGWSEPGRLWGSLGYVNLPGFVTLALLTAVTAPIGARLAHRLDRTLLKRLFAAFLGVVAVNLLREAFTH